MQRKLKIRKFRRSQRKIGRPCLYFGFTVKNGIKIADNEKAFIDVIYYQMKGSKFVFNPTSDVDLERIDKKKIMTYLKSYKNKRFVSYLKGIING